MSAARSRPATERVRLYDGARLTARDLRANETYEDRLRRLHVRGIHGTWGVAIGYEVTRADGGGVGIGPGIAYDCAGRPIVSARPLAVAPPPPPAGSNAPAWWFDLLIRFRDEASLVAACDPAGSLGPGCARLFEERPEVRWAFAGEARDAASPLAESARLGEDVPLARFLVGGSGGVLSDPDLSLRRNAQGLVRPHIAGGRVRQGSVTIIGSPLHWTATVDTTDGGFDTQSPFYFVSLVDHPFGPRSGFAPLVGHDPNLGFERLLGPFVSIARPQRTSFVLDVRSGFPEDRTGEHPLPAALFRAVHLKLPVAVDWVGLEPVGGCAPAFEWPVFLDFQQVWLDAFLTPMSAFSMSGGEL